MYVQSSTKADNRVVIAQSGNYRKPFIKSDIKNSVAFLHRKDTNKQEKTVYERLLANGKAKKTHWERLCTNWCIYVSKCYKSGVLGAKSMQLPLIFKTVVPIDQTNRPATDLVTHRGVNLVLLYEVRRDLVNMSCSSVILQPLLQLLAPGLSI